MMSGCRHAEPFAGDTHPQLPDRLRLPFAFDPTPLVRDLDGLPDDEWIAHFVTSNFEGQWTVIPLRGPAGATHPVRMIYSDPAASSFENTPLLGRVPAMRQLLEAFQCPLQSVRLMRLAPGSLIKEHRDHDLGIEHGTVRLHVPITTNPAVVFRLNGVPVVMAPGSVWYLRLCDPHSVSNTGDRDRVHLVIDAAVNDWLADMLKRAIAGVQETAGRGTV